MARNAGKGIRRHRSKTETILPDEADEKFTAFSEKFLAELAPKTEYANSIARDVMFAVWDIERHRRLLAAMITSQYKRQAERIFAGDPVHPGADSGDQIDNPWDLVTDLVANKPDAIAELARRGSTPSELTAAAFADRAVTVNYHESRIADLERRRGQLMAEYRRLQAASKEEDIEVAVEVK